MKKFAYVDVFVTPVPRKKLSEYKKLAKFFSKIWMEHGALHYVETIGDDIEAGKVTSFPRSLKLKRGEVACVAWVGTKSKAHRKVVFDKVMSDPRLAKYMTPDSMPFDGMRMFWGGFKPFITI